MNDICVPLPRVPDATHAEVSVKVDGKGHSFNFRVESFDWAPSEDLPDSAALVKVRNERIANLRASIANYDRRWELVQIYNPGPKARNIQVLFRQKLVRPT